MNESETRAEHIDPALAAAGWGVVEGSRIRREYPITLGRLEGQERTRGHAMHVSSRRSGEPKDTSEGREDRRTRGHEMHVRAELPVRREHAPRRRGRSG